MTPEQTKHIEKLDAAIDGLQDQIKSHSKYGADDDWMHDALAALKAHREIYPDLCAFHEAGEKATQGEWFSLYSYKEKKNHPKGDPDYDQCQVVTDREVVMHFGDTATYYPTAGEEPTGADLAFIITTANLRPAIAKVVG